MNSENLKFSSASTEPQEFQNRKLGKLLKLLTNKEKKHLYRWMQIELSHKMNRVIKFYEMVLAGESSIVIWRTLFPQTPCSGSAFKDSSFRKLESQLIKCIEDFIAIQSFRESPYFRDWLFIKELNQRNANDLFDLEIRRIHRKLDKEFKLEKEYYMMKYRLELENQKRLNKDHTKRKNQSASSLGEAFDTWWLHEKLWLANHDLNFQLIKGEKISTLFLEEVLDLVEHNENYNQFPLLSIYLQLYKALQGQEGPYQALELIKHHTNHLGERELKDIFALTFSYFTQKSNSSQEHESLRILLNLLEWGIEDRIIFTGKHLPWNWYKNLVTICIRLGDHDQAFQYINELKSYLHVEAREDAYRFNLAHYYFATGRFKEVLKISAEKYPNVYYEMHGRLIVCKTNYEINDLDELETRLRSLRIFINRQKDVSDRLKKSYTNQIKFLVALIKSYQKEDFIQLAKQVEGTYPMASKEWFLQKINYKLMKFNGNGFAFSSK